MDLTTLSNVLLMILGFGLVIVVHELGHFLAAKWAGVRVHSFALGFGSALCSWRKGLGFRLGSSEKEYTGALAAAPSKAWNSISPTEYRLNWIPFGGYVKMLGQEDGSPITPSSAKDSFPNKTVFQRMVIMSGGVFMNLVLAGVLFIAAYSQGLSEISPTIGEVGPDSPAEKAGLKAGDRVLTIDGEPVHTFNNLVLSVAMSGPGEPLKLTVGRDGEPAPVPIEVRPVKGAAGLLQIGAYPARSLALIDGPEVRRPADRKRFDEELTALGLGGLEPGMILTAIDDVPVGGPDKQDVSAVVLERALESAQGKPVRATFRSADSQAKHVTIELRARAKLQSGVVKLNGENFQSRHLLGLAPLARVDRTQPEAFEQGLRAGDVFIRIGNKAWPSTAEAIAEIRAHKGKRLDLLLDRGGERVSLNVRVSSKGVIGFLLGDTSEHHALVSVAPEGLEWSGAARRIAPGVMPGSRVLAVNGKTVASFIELRGALTTATAGAMEKSGPATVELTVAPPPALEQAAGKPEPARNEVLSWTLEAPEITALHGLSWDGSAPLSAFGMLQFLDRATGPIDAVRKGVAKTHYVIMMTYVTFARLVQRSVPVDQLHGPIGITHLGSQVAERGFIYLIFFLGLISANLAVINFMPLPIFDGGHMVFLFIELLTKKPVSVAVQNAATILGLLLIGTIFVVVTFNDVMRLLG